MSKGFGSITIDVVERGFDRAQKILAGVPDGASKAVHSALERAGQSGRSVATKSLTKEYAISRTQLLANVRNIDRVTVQGDSIQVVFGYAGYVIPLVRFDTTVSSDGYVSARVKTSGAKETLAHAFQAKVGSHTGIFERQTRKRLPIKELFGPSVPQMLSENKSIMDEIEEKIVETYEKRIDHEISRILNGYGG